MRKIVAMFGIGIILCFAVMGCGRNHALETGTLIKPTESVKPQTLKVIVDSNYWDGTAVGATYFREYRMKFEQSFGVKVEIISIGEKMGRLDATKNYCDKWSEVLAPILSQKNGPDIIAVGNVCAGKLIDKGLVVPCYDQIENTKNIYYGLQDEKKYFVPIHLLGSTQIMRKSELKKLTKKMPGFDWTPETYYKIYFDWLNNSGRILTRNDLTLVTYMDVKGPFFFKDILTAKIDTPAMRNRVIKVRKVLFANGNKGYEKYKLTNYENLFFNSRSAERASTIYWQYENKKLRNTCLENGPSQETISPFRVKQVATEMESGDFVVLPVPEDRYSIYPWGFMINKNASNAALAQTFINGLLSDEVQYTIFTRGLDSGMGLPYPVVDTIEKKIMGDERGVTTSEYAFQLKKYCLNKLKSEKLFLFPTLETQQDDFIHRFERDWIKLIFDDHYSEEGLNKKLEKLELKYKALLKAK